jgi:ribosomal protein S18 acetylase RimI-like enzyme
MTNQHEIRIATSDEALSDVASVAARARRGPATLEDVRHIRTTVGDPIHLVARVDGQPVGFAYAGVWPGTEDEGVAQGEVVVLPEHRRGGLGSALLGEISKHAAALGKGAMQFEVSEDDPESLAYLERRGYSEVERQMQVSLTLSEVDPESLPPAPEGVDIVTRAERPDLLREMHAVGEEAQQDVPGLDGGQAWSFDEWRTWEIDRPSNLPELCFIALDGDRVAGYALLQAFGDVAYHGFTAVGREWRRRGVGRALTVHQIAAAKAMGIEQLFCESEERNLPMRRLTESLGYTPLPAMIVMQGPPTLERS